MSAKTKKELAIEFITTIRNMEASTLQTLIQREAGEDLAQFFLSYSAELVTKEPARVLQNVSTLMLMGYLIRQHEDAGKGLSHRFPGLGLAQGVVGACPC